MPINPKKYSRYGLKNSYKEFDNEKNSCSSKIPLPPITFLMVRPLDNIVCRVFVFLLSMFNLELTLKPQG